MSKFFYQGTDVEIPTEDLARAVNAGEAEADAAGPVMVTDQAGNRVEVAADNIAGIGAYLNRGYRLEGAAETMAVEDRLEARHSPLQAAGEALLSGATLGLSNVAGRAIGGEDWANRAKMRREEFGENAATALEIAGGAIPALATGGSGIVARGLAATPAGLLARGAAGIGAAAERAALARGAGSAAAKILGMAAEGTLDGMVSNVGAALSEASLGNAELNAEYLVSAGAMGALLGGGIGGLFGGVAARSSRARQAADRLRSEVTGETTDQVAKKAGLYKVLPEPLADKIVGAVTKIGSASTGVDPALLREALENPSLRGDLLNSDVIEQSVNKQLRESAQSFLDESVYLRQLYNGEIKTENLARDVITSESAGNAALDTVQETFAEYLADLDDMFEKGILDKLNYNRLTNEILDTTSKVTKNLGSLKDEAGEGWKGFQAIENMKRAADSRRLQYANKSQGDLVSREVVPRVHAASAKLGDRLREVLESEDFWGIAGKKQRARNAALHRSLNNAKSFNRLIDGTGESLSREYWDIERKVLDGDKVDAFIKNILNPNREFTNEQIKEHLRAVGDLYETVINNDDVPAALVERFKKSSADARKMVQIIEEAEERLGRIGQLKAGLAAETEVSGAIGGLGGVGAAIGGFAAGVPGAVVGAAVGKAVDVAARPVSFIKNIARMETVAQRVRHGQSGTREATRKAVGALVGDSRPSFGTRVRATSRIAATRAATAHDREERKRRMGDIERRLLELQNDPTDLAMALGYQTEELAAVAPQHAMAFNAQVQRAVSFLRSKLPPPVSEINALQPQLTRRVWDDVTIDSFEKTLQTLEDPDTALRDMERGRLTSESVEVLREVYPHKYNDIRQAAIEAVSERADELPFNAVIQLSLLLGFNGDASMTPSYQAILQQADKTGHQSEAGGKEGVPSNFKPVSVPKTLTDRMSGGLERR